MADQKANELDIFNVNVDDVDFHDVEKKESDLYAPKAKDSKTGIYEALIRFLPNPKDPRKSIIKKYTYYLKNSEGFGKNYDSPSTIPGQKCPIQQTYYRLINSESAVERNMAKKLVRKENFYVLVQIIDDKVNPDLNGKIKVFKFGKKLKAKIDAERNPTYGEKVQMFHLFEGKNFYLRLTQQGDYNNYDQCTFLRNSQPIQINGITMTKSKDDLITIKNYLATAPLLENFEYKPWDESTEAEVMSILRSMRSPGKNLDEIVSKHSNSKEVKDYTINSSLNEKKSSINKFQEPEDEDLDDFLENLESELNE